MQVCPDGVNLANLLNVLVPATFGAAVALLAPVLISRLTRKRERAQWLWQKQFELLAEVEHLAGTLTDRLSGWSTGANWESLGGQVAQLDLLAGRFHLHPKMRQALKDYHNRAAIIVTDKGVFSSHHERERSIKELRDLCDAIFAESRRLLAC